MNDRVNFLTLDNGGDAFRVEVIKAEPFFVRVTIVETGEFITEFPADQVWVDEKPLTHQNLPFTDPEEGVAVIAKYQNLPDLWLYIGDELYTFSPWAPIIHFTCPVGNSAVVYAWALDDHGNVYLFTERIILVAWHRPNTPIPEDEAPYTHYYNLDSTMVADHTGQSIRLQHSADPEGMFERFDEDNPWRLRGKDAFISAHQQYGLLNGFGIMITTTLRDRAW